MNRTNERLIASIALFGELYDSKKDLQFVIAELLRTSIIHKAKWSFNLTEAGQIFGEVFGFSIPDAVVRSVLKNRLIKDGTLVPGNDGTFLYRGDKSNAANAVNKEFAELIERHERIFQELREYVEKKLSKLLSAEECLDLRDSFNQYLLNSSSTVEYAEFISSFIIVHESNDSFIESLNSVREGTILYEGICYSSDINSLGTWKTPLTVFLETEILFHALGCNGILFEQMFADFHDLVKEINSKSSKTGGRIDLRYFLETRHEIDGFFFIAERIIEGKAELIPSKTAMTWIVNGCSKPSDVLAKKASFYENLSIMGIHEEAQIDYYKNPGLNIEDAGVIDSLSHAAVERGEDFDEAECSRTLKLFTKINVLRKGISNMGFERAGYILISGKRSTLNLAHSNFVKVDEGDVPFASDAYYITARLWFKMNKGLAARTKLPKTFDIVARAQVVISSLLNSAVSNSYNELTKKFKAGKLSAAAAEYRLGDLRSHASKPEDIRADEVDAALAFLNDSSLESHLREKAMLIQQAEEGKVAREELQRVTAGLLRGKKKPLKRSTKLIYTLGVGLFWLIVLAIPVSVWCFINTLRAKEDTNLAVVGTFATIILGVLALIGFRKRVASLKMRFRKQLQRRYLSRIPNA